MILALFPYLCAAIAILTGAGGLLVVLSIIAAWKEDQALARKQPTAIPAPPQVCRCVSEAQAVAAMAWDAWQAEVDEEL